MNEFWQIYCNFLREKVEANRENYHIADTETATAYAERITSMFSQTGSIGRLNIDSPAFRATAKHFNVPCTYKALGPLAFPE